MAISWTMLSGGNQRLPCQQGDHHDYHIANLSKIVSIPNGARADDRLDKLPFLAAATLTSTGQEFTCDLLFFSTISLENREHPSSARADDRLDKFFKTEQLVARIFFSVSRT